MGEKRYAKWGRRRMIEAIKDDIRSNPDYYKGPAQARRIDAIAEYFGIRRERAVEYVDIAKRTAKRKTGIDSFAPGLDPEDYD